MTFSALESTRGHANEALDMARTRLAEHGDTAERAVRFHLAEAIVLELAALRKEVAALHADLKPRA